MTGLSKVDERTPILVGAGQVVQREASDESPMHLAALASARALEDCGASAAARHIDSVCVTKLFSDMSHLWPCRWGRSDNPPESVAMRIGAKPIHRIYTQTGGNEPQSRLIEFAADIARGDRDMVLLTGAEALKNQRHAERQQRELDWNEHFDTPLEDRGFGDSVATRQELKNGFNNVIYYYALIEQAQRHKAGRSVEQHRQEMAKMLASFSAVAATNPYAQFAGQQSAADILAAPDLTHLYTKRMIAQDGVNQAAALIMCSVAKARELGIDELKWVFIHGMAEGRELELSHRDDPAKSPVALQVAQSALDMAELEVEAVDIIDIYSCFPCAVTAVAEQLKLPTDGSKALTITGGLPYFGGPGNNYGMHALAEMVTRLRRQPSANALITSNGGVLSKHASGVYSRLPSGIDWAVAETNVSNDSLSPRRIAPDPSQGKIVSYSVHMERGDSAHAVILGETDVGERFVARTMADDQATPARLLESEPTGQPVNITAGDDEKLHFQIAQ